MLHSRVRLVAAAAVLAVSGCASGPGAPVACTEIGAPAGIAVTLAPELVPAVDRLALQVCFGGACRSVPVQLNPGSTTLPQDCPTDDPDGSCAASAVPDGTLVGFADVADLPTGPVEVGATLSRNGRTRTYDPIGVQSVTVFPNGSSCPGEGNQARVRLTAEGLIG